MMLKEVARGQCALIVGRIRDEASGHEAAPSTLSFVQAQKSMRRWKNITLEVESDADRLVVSSYLINTSKP